MPTASLLFIGLIMAVGAISAPTDNVVVPETSVTAPNEATDTKVAESGSVLDEQAILVAQSDQYNLPTFAHPGVHDRHHLPTNPNDRTCRRRSYCGSPGGYCAIHCEVSEELRRKRGGGNGCMGSGCARRSSRKDGRFGRWRRRQTRSRL